MFQPGWLSRLSSRAISCSDLGTCVALNVTESQDHISSGLLQVCKVTGVDPSDIQYVEAHGTGTVVGDSQELMAIDGLYGRGGRPHSPGAPAHWLSQVQHGPLRGLLRPGRYGPVLLSCSQSPALPRDALRCPDCISICPASEADHSSSKVLCCMLCLNLCFMRPDSRMATRHTACAENVGLFPGLPSLMHDLGRVVAGAELQSCMSFAHHAVTAPAGLQQHGIELHQRLRLSCIHRSHQGLPVL